MRDLREEALERASKYSPPPRHDPLLAGFAGAAIAGAVLGVFLGFAGLDQTDFGNAFAATVALGFIVPYAIYWDQRRRHRKAVQKEFTALWDRSRS